MKPIKVNNKEIEYFLNTKILLTVFFYIVDKNWKGKFLVNNILEQ